MLVKEKEKTMLAVTATVSDVGNHVSASRPPFSLAGPGRCLLLFSAYLAALFRGQSQLSRSVSPPSETPHNDFDRLSCSALSGTDSHNDVMFSF